MRNAIFKICNVQPIHGPVEDGDSVVERYSVVTHLSCRTCDDTVQALSKARMGAQMGLPNSDFQRENECCAALKL